MRVAGIQTGLSASADRNMDRAAEMAEVAAEKGARIICYPALFMTPWFPRKEDARHFSLAQDEAGKMIERFREISKTLQAVLILPFFEAAGGKHYNSAAVVDCGKISGIYRKVHLPNLPLYREQFYFSPGDNGFPVFETSQGRIGIQICWDNLFPEGSRILALKGAEIIFSPTAASLNTHALWERAITSNAFANNLFIFRVNRVGKENDLHFYGRSFCADPWGEMVSELAGGKEAIVIADIDLAERKTAMDTWGFLKHRRPAEYEDLAK